MSTRARLLALIISSSSLALAADDSPFGRTLDAGKALLESGDAAAAGQKFQEAMLADPQRYEGYFYLAVVSYRNGDLTAAAEFASAALERAPEGEKGQIGEMINVIDHRRNAEAIERQGEEALAKGLRARAADSFRKAYELSPKNGPLGLKAAALYADTLKRLLDAAALWRKIAATADEPSADIARQELNRRNSELEKLFKEQLDGSQVLLNKGDTSSLERLIEIFPDRWEPHLALGAYLVDKSEYAKGTEHLGRASALGIDPQHIKFNKLLIWAYNRDDAEVFRTFIEEAFGSEVGAHLKDMPLGYSGADTPEKQEMYREAIRQGHMWAAVNMADSFWFGFEAHAPENPAEAIRLYRLAADAGYAAGLYKMGHIYLNGYNVDADPALAERYLRAGVAKGDEQAMADLATMFAQGIGMAANENEAIRLWKEAADLGSWSATSNLANFYVSRKNTDAIPLAEKMAASDANFIARDGWYVLGLCQRDGIGGPVDLDEARKLLTKAAELGSEDAQTALAKLR